MTTDVRARSVRRVTLATGLDLRRNSLNALRLIFALFVLVGHGFHLGANAASPHIGSFLMPDIGVDGFFVISGFLITHSGLSSSSTRRFLWARVLRIFPAYLACLAVTAFAITPVLLWQGGRSAAEAFGWSNGGWTYVLYNATLLQLQHGVAGMPSSSPVPGLLNGSLWTLMYEFVAYLVVAALVARGALQRFPAVSIALFALSWVVLLWSAVSLNSLVSLTHSHEVLPWGSRLAVMFSVGMIARMYAHRVPLNWRWMLVSLAITLAVSPMAQPRLIAAPFFAYVVLWLGSQVGLSRIGSRRDISYGVYLYGWPVEQILSGSGADQWQLAAYIGVAVVGAALLGLASCVVVEMPALKLKKARSGRESRSVAKELNELQTTGGGRPRGTE